MERISKIANYPARSLTELIDRDEVIADLARLVSYPSCSFPGYDIEHSVACAYEVARMVRAAGFTHVEMLDVGGRTPVVWAQHRADTATYPDAPTLMCYAHYDVQPAPVEAQGWDTDPFVLTLGEDGRYYGRGACDDKAGIVGHLHAIKVAGGLAELDHVNINLCFEGEEECFGTLEGYIEQYPERFAADAYLVFDLGNIEVGEPSLTTDMRGTAIVDVEVHAIRQELHSGLFGGPTPDALKGLTMMLASLWDEDGNTTVEGIKSFDWTGAPYPEELLRRDVGLVQGADLVGTGPVSDQLFSRPAASIIGLDATPVAKSSNVIIPRAKARVSVRFPYGQTSREAIDAIVAHLQKHAPHGIAVNFPFSSAASAFSTSVDGSFVAAFTDALCEAFGAEVTHLGSGGSVPLLSVLQRTSPEADFLLYGVSDWAKSNLHGGNESVDPLELERTICAEAIFLRKLQESA
jgi:acetylornithine deacetylase/succinyl-diaminopimelate desuccinylase-like protein